MRGPSMRGHSGVAQPREGASVRRRGLGRAGIVAPLCRRRGSRRKGRQAVLLWRTDGIDRTCVQAWSSYHLWGGRPPANRLALPTKYVTHVCV